jgi:hypothetical protein
MRWHRGGHKKPRIEEPETEEPEEWKRPGTGDRMFFKRQTGVLTQQVRVFPERQKFLRLSKAQIVLFVDAQLRGVPFECPKCRFVNIVHKIEKTYDSDGKATETRELSELHCPKCQRTVVIPG